MIKDPEAIVQYKYEPVPTEKIDAVTNTVMKFCFEAIILLCVAAMLAIGWSAFKSKLNANEEPVSVGTPR